MKNSKLIKFSITTLLPVIMAAGAFSCIDGNKTQKVDAAGEDPHLTYYHNDTLPTTIDLNDADSTTIRGYYANLDGQNLSGDDLLGALKPILSNGQKYFSYESNDAIWTAYEITDRDWEKSPATDPDFPGDYDPDTGIVTNYSYHETDDYDDPRNPYIRALYVDRDFDNPMKAWSKNLGQAIYGDNPKGYYAHAQRWGGFNQEHIWAKAHGFNAVGHGGARGDLMHLWPGDGRANLMHNDNCFGYVDKLGADAKHVVFDGVSDAENYAINNWIGTSATVPINEYDNAPNKVFEPQDSDKGDIARAIFYMCARYNHINDSDEVTSDEPWLTISDKLDAAEPRSYTSTSEKKGVMGVMSDLLEWNRIDPVDEFEIHRNNILFNSFTYNRNPFIDFPQWADIIWGEKSGVANPASDVINNSEGTEDVTVDYLEIYSPANKRIFRNGDPFDSTGLVVKAHYSDQSVKEVTARSKITPVNMNVGGEHEVEIKFGGKTTSYTIEIFHEKFLFDKKTYGESRIDNFEQVSNDDVTINFVKSGNNVPYFNGTNMHILGNNKVQFEGLHKIKQIDIRYMGKQATTTSVVSLESGSGNYSETTRDNEFIGTWEGSSNTVTFKTTGVRDIRQIDILYDDGYQLTGLNINGDTLEYQKFYDLEEFDSEKGEVQQTVLNIISINAKAVYKDGKTKNLDFEDLSVSGFETDSIGEKSVSLVYAENGIKKEFALNGIRVRDLTNMSISASVVTGSVFYYGKDLDKSNFKVVASFPGEDPETVDSSEFEITNYNKNQLGNQNVTISYCGKTKQVQINVVDYDDSISVVIDSDAVFLYGDELDKSNFIVTKHTASGATSLVSNFSISGYNKFLLGNQTLTITLGNLTNAVNISVQDYIASIRVEGEYYDQYEQGTEFDPDGIEIIASYAGPTEDFTLSLSQVTFSELDTSVLGSKTIVVTFVDTATGQTLTASFDVEVVEPESLLFGCFGSVIASSSLITLMSLAGIGLLLAKKKEN